MPPRKWRRVLPSALGAMLIVVSALAQGREFGGFGPRGPFHVYPNIHYDGRFTFVRLSYETAPGGYWYGGWPAWGHGYPLAEQNLMRILNEISFLHPHIDEINTLALDDPELFKYPIAYIIEVGWWTMSDREGAALRAYLQKGGFVIVDDFRGRHWDAFVAGLGRVLPDARLVRLDAANPIFDVFFRVDPYTLGHPYFAPGPPAYYGVFEDNDPSRRLMLVANYNNDIAEYWEWSDTGFVPIDVSNEAYKLGVNYVVYGMTH
jgi:hypothetical protein